MSAKEKRNQWSDYNILLTDKDIPIIVKAIGDTWNWTDEAYQWARSHHEHDARHARDELLTVQDALSDLQSIETVRKLIGLPAKTLAIYANAVNVLTISSNLMVEAMPDGPAMDRLVIKLQSCRPVINRICSELGFMADVKTFEIENPYPTIIGRRSIATERKSAIWEKSNGVCWYCGSILNPFSNFHIDHVIPFSAGGSDEIDNLVPSCSTCNLSKHDQSVDEFRIRFGRPFWFEKREG